MRDSHKTVLSCVGKGPAADGEVRRPVHRLGWVGVGDNYSWNYSASPRIQECYRRTIRPHVGRRGAAHLVMRCGDVPWLKPKKLPGGMVGLKSVMIDAGKPFPSKIRRPA